MSELLSNDQVAELVAAAKEGGELRPSAATRKRARRVRTIDFSLPNRFTLEQQRRLERAHAGFCRTIGPILSAELGTAVECELIDVSQLTYANALDELPHAPISATARLVELDTRVLLALDGSAAAGIVNRMLGGTHHEARLFDPEPTQIELGLLRRLFSTCVVQLSREWREVAGTRLEVDEVDIKLTNLEVAARSEPCLAFTIELRVDDRAPTMSVVVPFVAIAGIAHRLETPHDHEANGHGSDWQLVLDRLRGVRVLARAEVAHTELTLEEILSFQPGDVIPLRRRKDTGVTLAVGETAMHRCVPGRNGNRRAIEVVERCEVEE